MGAQLFNHPGMRSLSTREIIEAVEARTGWRDRVLGGRLGVSANSLRNWKAGRNPSFGNIKKACAVLRITPDQFLGLAPVADDFLDHLPKQGSEPPVRAPAQPGARNVRQLVTLIRELLDAIDAEDDAADQSPAKRKAG
jgi:transcriptional regulator with XRE-family HTH domain